MLETIEWGKTLTYKAVANTLNKPSAVRAVGTAIGKNPSRFSYRVTEWWAATVRLPGSPVV